MKASLLPPFLIAGGFFVVLTILWNQEFKYYLPSGNYSELPLEQELDLDFIESGKPSFFHFFSKECKSSRVNIDHVNPLFEKYADVANFYIICDSKESAAYLDRIQSISSKVKIIEDGSHKISQSLNVKSLPYALIINTDKTLFFGGNYNNKNGLCGPSDIIWSSPALALKFLSEQKKLPLFPDHQLAFVGCATN